MMISFAQGHLFWLRHLGQPQLRMMWAVGISFEESFLQALERAEAISGSNHVRILPTLINLGDVYSHTGRATLAEGLYRQASSHDESCMLAFPLSQHSAT